MLRQMLKSKIHRCTVTGSDLEYEGSIAIDPVLLREADIFPFERVSVWNVTNGERFDTYAIEGRAREVMVNGAAARKVAVGDVLIVVTWGLYNSRREHIAAQRVVLVDKDNKIKG